jgi:glycosyltransferase involved in cell wall biosynthesis
MNKRLAVTLDVSSIPYGRGVSRYTSNLATALASHSEIDLSFWGVSWQHAEQLHVWMSQFGSRVQKKLIPLPPKLLHLGWKHGFPPLKMLDSSRGVFHAWEWQVPPPSTRAQVVTIHDLAHMLYPEVAHPDVVERFDRLLEMWKKNSWPIIAVSQATKNDILRLTSITKERIHVIHEALPTEAEYVPAEEERLQVLQSLGLKKPFLLIVGTREPRKNMKRMIEAWLNVREDVDCVIVGAAGWDELPSHKGLHIMNYLDPKELSSLYRSASGLLFASLYEGFGLPILEAFFHGCPVVTSRVSSMPEVAGEAAMYCDPYSVESITDALAQLPKRGTKPYAVLHKKMMEQLSQFSWEKAAKETIAVYKIAQELS